MLCPARLTSHKCLGNLYPIWLPGKEQTEQWEEKQRSLGLASGRLELGLTSPTNSLKDVRQIHSSPWASFLPTVEWGSLFELHDPPAPAHCKSVNGSRTYISHILLVHPVDLPKPWKKLVKTCISVPIFQDGKTETLKSQRLITNFHTNWASKGFDSITTHPGKS